MARAAIVVERRHDSGLTLTEQVCEGELHFRRGEWLPLVILNGGGVAAVPVQAPYGIRVLPVGSGAGDETTNAIDQAVAAFPDEVADVIGNAKLPMQHGGQQVVAGTLVPTIEEVEHANLVLVAVIEADGAAVAIPESIAWGYEEPHLVSLETCVLHGCAYNRLVAGFLYAHPGLCSCFLNAIHDI